MTPARLEEFCKLLVKYDLESINFPSKAGSICITKKVHRAEQHAPFERSELPQETPTDEDEILFWSTPEPAIDPQNIERMIQEREADQAAPNG